MDVCITYVVRVQKGEPGLDAGERPLQPLTFLDVGSLLPDDVRVLGEGDVDLERNSRGLGIEVGKNELPGSLDVARQTHHLHLGIWEHGNMGMSFEGTRTHVSYPSWTWLQS